MYSVEVGSHEIALTTSFLGVEKVYMNDKLVSKKRFSISSWHSFDLNENGTVYHYKLGVGLGSKPEIAQVYKNNELVYEHPNEATPGKKKFWLIIVLAVMVGLTFQMCWKLFLS